MEVVVLPMMLMAKDDGHSHDVQETETDTRVDVTDVDGDGQFQIQMPDVCVEQPKQRDSRSSWKDEMSTEFPPIKEPLMFDGIVGYHFLSPYLLNLEQERRIVTNEKENEWSHTKKKLLTQRQARRYEMNNNDTAKTVAVTQMMDCIGDYLKNEGDEFFRGGELSMCGSVAEGTKVSSCDEFDYQYLITLEECEAVRKQLLRTKPRSAKVESKSFFSLKLIKENDEMELKSHEIHDRFLEQVGKGLVRFSTSPLNGLDTKRIVKAGPAVKLVLWSETDFVKVDITLGIKSDPLKLFKEEELTDLARSLPWGINLDCHFICANDYWKVSFVDTEQHLMREISQRDPYKAACYRAIKCVRDKVDVKDHYGDGILPSYPIKITFMSIALEDSTKDIMWSMEDTSLHVIHILEEVENRGQSHQLNDLFLKGEEVMSESDRSYLESRRILDALKSAEDVYINQKDYVMQWFTAMVALFLFPYFTSFWIYGAAWFGCLPVFAPTSSESWIELRQINLFFFHFVISAWWSKALFAKVVAVLRDVVHLCTSKLHITSYCTGLSVWLSKAFSANQIPALMHLYTIYPSISCFYTNYLLAYFLVLVLTLESLLFGKFGPKDFNIFSIVFVIMVQVMCLLPVIVFAVSMIIYARRSISLHKNIALFNSHLVISWQWTDPTHQKHPYNPELYGTRGFTKVAKLRAYLVLIITSAVISLTLLSNILELILYLNKSLGIVTVDLGIEKGPLFGVYLLNLLLMFILRLLVNHQLQYINPDSYQTRKISYGYLINLVCCCAMPDSGFHKAVNSILTKLADAIFREPFGYEPFGEVNDNFRY